MDGKFVEFCKAHKFAIIFAAIGLLLAILFMTIGFWRTLLLFLLIAVFFLIGLLLDQNGPGGLKAFFDRLFSRRKS